MTDASGLVINQTQYKAWGEERYSSGAKQTNYSYTGQYSYAGDFGLQFYNARWYDSSLGRFTSADTIVPGAESPEAWDRYAYTTNNPLRYTDPTGHRNCEEDGYNCPGDKPVYGLPNCSRYNPYCTFFGNFGDPSYYGSGWGHGLRKFQNDFGFAGFFKSNTRDSTAGLMWNAFFHEPRTELGPTAVSRLRNDPQQLEFEDDLIALAISKNISFTDSRGVTFGGDRDPAPMKDQLLDPFNPEYSETWAVARNPLAWQVRWARVNATVTVSETRIVITYQLYDKLDLRPINGRTEEYNNSTGALGFIWHDMLGANDNMVITAQWHTEIVK